MSFYKKYKNIILGIFLLIVLVVTFQVWRNAQQEEPTGDRYVWNSTLEPEYIEVDGQKYTLNPKVETILIGGVDKDGKVTLTSGNRSGGQVDMLMLLVINSETKMLDIIQINRDTMTEINMLNDKHLVSGTAYTQIALSHSYGNGGTLSCNNTVDAVEKLLYGIDIDKYFFLNVGAVPILNDFFGGVEVTVEDDFSNVDESLVMGETIKLNGTQAHNFLRARMQLSDPTNENRMKRHRQYIDALIDKVRTSIKDKEVSATSLYNSLYDYMVTSLSSSEITSLVMKTADYTQNEIIVPEGEIDDSGEYIEFYPDEESLKSTVMNLFYIPLGEVQTEIVVE